MTEKGNKQVHWSHRIQKNVIGRPAKSGRGLEISVIIVLTLVVAAGMLFLLNEVFILPSLAPSVKSESDVTKVQSDTLSIGTDTSSLLKEIKNLVR